MRNPVAYRIGWLANLGVVIPAKAGIQKTHCCSDRCRTQPPDSERCRETHQASIQEVCRWRADMLGSTQESTGMLGYERKCSENPGFSAVRQGRLDAPFSTAHDIYENGRRETRQSSQFRRFVAGLRRRSVAHRNQRECSEMNGNARKILVFSACPARSASRTLDAIAFGQPTARRPGQRKSPRTPIRGRNPAIGPGHYRTLSTRTVMTSIPWYFWWLTDDA